MKLGKLQKFWVGQLKAHPERQTSECLGTGVPRDYKACCLGELLLCAFRLKKEKLPFLNEEIWDGSADEANFYLTASFGEYGLRSFQGSLEKSVSATELRGQGILGELEDNPDGPSKAATFTSLAAMNDSRMTWPEIAKFIEKKPHLVFTKSV